MIIDNSKPNKKQFISGYRTDCTEEDINFTLVFGKDCSNVEKSLRLIDSRFPKSYRLSGIVPPKLF